MSKPPLRPHQLVLGIGIAFAAVTAASGIAASVFAFHEDTDAAHREVFGNVPGAVKFAFYALTCVLILYGAWNFAQRTRNWQRGAPDRRSTTASNARRRLHDYRGGVLMQTLLRDPAAGVMHALLYYGFWCCWR